MSKRVIIVDGHAIVRSGLVELIQRRPGLRVVAEAANAADAMRVVAQHDPDLLVLEVSLGVGMNGIELLKHLRGQRATLRMLVLSMHDEETYAERSLAAGANGYLMKRETVDHFHEAIDRVLAGQTYASPAMFERILGRRAGRSHTGELDNLSDREMEVLALLGRGLGTREIAMNLHVSIKTVETYRASLKAKLAIETAPQLVRFAVQWIDAG